MEGKTGRVLKSIYVSGSCSVCRMLSICDRGRKRRKEGVWVIKEGSSVLNREKKKEEEEGGQGCSSAPFLLLLLFILRTISSLCRFSFSPSWRIVRPSFLPSAFSPLPSSPPLLSPASSFNFFYRLPVPPLLLSSHPSIPNSPLLPQCIDRGDVHFAKTRADESLMLLLLLEVSVAAGCK